jgi:hypothetical protein
MEQIMIQAETVNRYGQAAIEGLSTIESELSQENGTGDSRFLIVIGTISAVMSALAVAVLCVIVYHFSYGAEIYRRGQEHAAAEISIAAQQVGSALTFQYESDKLCVIILRKKGIYKQARKMAEGSEK